eukprot:GFUD01002899.1.p1 GENE.GFUD01002899.1~~GFUD01002899.1.p1  ORF type:complete len:474 (+),score=123.92 GFUD01002899.1:539-1960(+)
MGDSIKLDGYTVGDMVGRGTQGTVYKAYTKSEPRRAVAIKCIFKKKLSKSAQNNIITEIGLLKKLKHRFIVELIDFHWDDKFIYIVMEFCGGGDLSRVIKHKRCLPELHCQRFLQQLASALQFLREHNVSHMDLKPSNLIVKGSNPPILKMADFGFAQHLEADSMDKGLVGSPLYMAPEIFLKDQYNAKADLWSIGVILYEALFGRAPFSSDTLEELVPKIKEDTPIIIPRSGKLSPECRDLLSRCLVRSPEKRIDFCDFFDHPFLDLEHLPGEDSFQKASKLVTDAVEADKEKDLKLAVELYDKSLKYFHPIIYYETDLTRRSKLKKTIAGYEKRSQELQRLLSGEGQSSSKTAVLRTYSRQEKLVNLCRSSSNLLTGVEICLSGEDYQMEGELGLALDKITSGLGILVPALQVEPKGPRRDLLRTAVTGWMEKAEKIKEVMNVQEEVLTKSESGGSDTIDCSDEKQSCTLQ